MKLFKTLFLAALVLAVTPAFASGIGSSSGGDDKPESIILVEYGSVYGNCPSGHCGHSVIIRQNPALPKFKILTEYDLDGIGTDPSGEVKSKSKILTDRNFGLLKSKAQVPVFKQLKPVYGCPDCADGGTHWIKITGDKGYVGMVKYESLDAVKAEMEAAQFASFEQLVQLLEDLRK